MRHAEPPELPVYSLATRKGRPIRWRGPMDLVTWLRANGGLRDDRGELRARDLHRWFGGRTSGVRFAAGEGFLGRLVHPAGMSIDDATLRAWEAGYFPGHRERPTPDDLLAAIDRTIAAGARFDGRVWSEHDFGLIDHLTAELAAN
jgi:hypothetical protein